MSIADRLEGKRVVICAGSGGVGKTTTSAALAMGLAAQGRKVAVVTIDPAKRLADSLGLEELDNEPRLVDAERFRGHGIEMQGELWAMMLDPKRTFDELITRLAPDDRTRDEVLANRIYQELSGAVAGSQEFTAIAKLYELDRSGDFDVLVLDTPPSRNALDFLDAPDRLAGFFEGRALKVFLAPTGIAAKVMGRGTSVVFSVLRRVTGVDLLQDLSVFFRALGGLVDGFRERARGVKRLLADPATTFLIVTSPEREPVEVDIIWGFPFNHLPQAARTYIATAAARRFQAQKVSSTVLDRFNETDEERAFVLLQRYERRSRDTNSFRRSPSLRKWTGRRAF